MHTVLHSERRPPEEVAWRRAIPPIQRVPKFYPGIMFHHKALSTLLAGSLTEPSSQSYTVKVTTLAFFQNDYAKQPYRMGFLVFADKLSPPCHLYEVTQ